MNKLVLSEINPLAKIYHCSNIEVLIHRLENGIELVKSKKPDRKNLIEPAEKSITDLTDLRLWIETLYSALEEAKASSLNQSIINLHLIADRQMLSDRADKLIKTLEFNEKP